MTSKNVERPTQIPDKPHFAIISQGSISVPGDERSRTNPGHGYPASTEYFIRYQAFEDRADWERVVAAMSKAGENFRAISVTPATLTTTVTVAVA